MKATVTAMRVFENWLVWLTDLVYKFGLQVGLRRRQSAIGDLL
jgi:hypothetical protein